MIFTTENHFTVGSVNSFHATANLVKPIVIIFVYKCHKIYQLGITYIIAQYEKRGAELMLRSVGGEPVRISAKYKFHRKHLEVSPRLSR